MTAESMPDRAPGSSGSPSSPSSPSSPISSGAASPARPRALTRVQKRDGREARFDPRKIASAVAAAMAAVGEDDPGFPDEVAGVVQLTLERRHASLGSAACPGIEEIQDLVEQALIEMGRAAVAKAYILYRDRRARVRAALRVHKGPAPLARLQVQEADRTSPWSKGRIVAALLAEADLPRDVAEDVAARVEERVFASGLSRITTGLVRELVDNVLVAMGLTAALRRQESVGLPRHDLRRILAGIPLEDWELDASATGPGHARPDPVRLDTVQPDPVRPDPARAVAGEVLRRYALEDVLEPGVAELHLAGDLHVEDLRQPHLPLTLSVPSELLMRGEPSPGGAFELLAELASVAGGTARGVLLEDPALVLQPLVRGTRPGSPLGLGAWLRALAAASRAAGRRIDLGTPGARFSSFGARLCTELAGLVREPNAPRLFLDGDELAALAETGPEARQALEELLGAGRLVPTWAAADAPRTTAPGCQRHARERTALSSAGAIVLNLPRLARRAGPWREDVFLEQLAEMVRCALSAARSLESFRAGQQLVAAGGLRARAAYALVPAGLREALQLLTGGEVDPELGSRILGLAAEAAGRFAERGDPRLLLSPFHGAEGSARFARLDAEAQRGQGTLFDDRSEFRGDAAVNGSGARAVSPGGSPAPPAGAAYAQGFRISPVPGFWPGEAEARLSCTVPTGALWPLPSGGRPSADPRLDPRAEPLSNLGAWQRFAAGRVAARDQPGATLWPRQPNDPPSPPEPPQIAECT